MGSKKAMNLVMFLDAC